VAVYADGGCIRANPSRWGGTWAWCGIDADGWKVREGSGLLIPGEGDAATLREVTNNNSEFYAVLAALEAMPDGWSGKVCSDSKVTLSRLFRSASLNGIPIAWSIRLGRALGRLGRLEPVQMDGHPSGEHLRAGVGKRGYTVSRHQQWCDNKCRELAGLRWLAISARRNDGETEAEPGAQARPLEDGPQAARCAGGGEHPDPPQDDLLGAAAQRGDDQGRERDPAPEGPLQGERADGRLPESVGLEPQTREEP
jgi:hypothetical protein